MQFVTRHGEDTESARSLFVQGDTQGAARLVHEVAGVTSFLGILELARLAVQTEKALLSGELAQVPGLFDELAEAMGQLRESCQGITPG